MDKAYKDAVNDVVRYFIKRELEYAKSTRSYDSITSKEVDEILANILDNMPECIVMVYSKHPQCLDISCIMKVEEVFFREVRDYLNVRVSEDTDPFY